METPVEQLPPLDEYQRRFVANMDWLRAVNQFSWADVQRKAGLSDRALGGWRSPKGPPPNPTLSNLTSVAGVLGVEPGDMLLPEEALKMKVAREGLRPFVDPTLVNRPTVNLHSSEGSEEGSSEGPVNGGQGDDSRFCKPDDVAA